MKKWISISMELLDKNKLLQAEVIEINFDIFYSSEIDLNVVI